MVENILQNARRIPFTDDMLRLVDTGMKTETRRPVRYLLNGKRAKCMYGRAGGLLLATGSHIFVDEHNRECDSRDPKAKVLYQVDWKGKPEVEEWRPPMFLPKRACNRFLSAELIKETNLCDITEEQAIAEGISVKTIEVDRQSRLLYYWKSNQNEYFPTAVEAFRSLWDTIHTSRGLWFDQNPRVWRIKFGLIDMD